MSTYLQLCQKLRQEVEGAGTGPSAVTGQTGVNARYVGWIADAWTELQQEHDDWLWMRKSFTVSATSGDGDYAYTECTDTVSAVAIARWSRWYPYSFKCYLTASGVGAEYPLIWVPWENFRARYRYGTQTNSQPIHVSMDPTLKFVLGPIPNDTFTVSGDYQIGPQTLAADADEPEMPARFHNLIVYEAMIKYGFNSVAPEILSRANGEALKLRSPLIRMMRPQICIGPSLDR